MQTEKKGISLYSLASLIAGLIATVISFGLILWLGGLIVTFGSMYAAVGIKNRLLSNLATLLLFCPPSLLFATLAALIIRRSNKINYLLPIPMFIITTFGCAFILSITNLFLGQLVAKGTGEMSYYFVLGYVSIFFPSLLSSGMIGWVTGKFIFARLVPTAH